MADPATCLKVEAVIVTSLFKKKNKKTIKKQKKDGGRGQRGEKFGKCGCLFKRMLGEKAKC
jgi:hypothetical protein